MHFQPRFETLFSKYDTRNFPPSVVTFGFVSLNVYWTAVSVYTTFFIIKQFSILFAGLFPYTKYTSLSL
jgi:hypothetical protein